MRLIVEDHQSSGILKILSRVYWFCGYEMEYCPQCWMKAYRAGDFLARAVSA
jgi:hypothetical protein